jgi:amino acid adenylation domain-containing protein
MIKTDLISPDSPEDVSAPQTLIDLLRLQAQLHPQRLAYTFLAEGDSEESSLSFAQLDLQARAIASYLQPLVSPGERVLLLFPPGLDYIAAFFGCLYAGAVVVPAYPPRRNRNILRLQSIVADTEASIALTNAAILSRIVPFFSQNPYLRPLRWLTIDALSAAAELNWQPPPVNSESLAFLQYTSGSTSAPKGVMLSHGNLLHNEQMMQLAFEQTNDSIIVGWLPLYHDMGLIGNVIQPLFSGARCILMSPIAFLQQPLRWLQAISHYKATTSGGPNFAYDLCVRKIPPHEREALDLSSWRIAFNGSEAVRQDTLTRFAAAFASCGFRPQAFYPCYGLAEATLLVSGHPGMRLPVVKNLEAKALECHRVEAAGSAAENVRTLVGCGHALLQQRIVIADPETLRQCSAEEVGEIWVAGPSVAQGYWNRPAETQQSFQAHLADTGEGPFLRTGDLGFLQDGELFVTGRLKDLVIIRGLNRYPQDIELSVQNSHGALRPDAGAAFAIDADGEERLIIVQEVERRRLDDVEKIVNAIREAVADEHDVQVHAIVLIRPGSIAKTSSGKIQRHACRAAFLESSLEVVAEWHSAASAESEHVALNANALSTGDAGEITAWLRAKLAARLGVKPESIDPDQPIARYGLDSLAAIEIAHSLEAAFGIHLPLASLLDSRSLAQAASSLDASKSFRAPGKGSAVLEEDGAEHPLSRGQQALWFLHQLAPQSAAYHIASAVRVISEVDTGALRRAFQALVNRHPALRTTFQAIDGVPVQRIHERQDVCFEEVEAGTWSEAELDERLAEAAHAPFDLEQGPLLRVSLFRRQGGEHVLLLVVHHIVADLWSLGVLLDELGRLYDGERDGTSSTLAPLPLQYTDYVRWQEELLASAEGERLLNYWKQQLGGELPVLNLPTDHPRPSVQSYRGGAVSCRLSVDLVQALKALGQRQGATLYMTLLAAFNVLLARYTGQREFVVGTPTTGRNWNTLTGIVGYFVNSVVVRTEVDSETSFVKLLSEVRRTVLAAFEHQDYPFPLLVERLQPERDASRTPLFQVMFILQKGQMAQVERLGEFASGAEGTRVVVGGLEVESKRLEQGGAQFDLTLTMAEADEELIATVEYNQDLFETKTINRLLERFSTLLKSIAAQPERLVSLLPVLPEYEEQLLLRRWNDTRRDYARDLCLHQMFERQVARTPDAEAIVRGSERLSYRELNRRANRLARLLRTMGVGPEVLVGLLMARGIEMVVGLLGILKAGGAYVPADPAYPRARLRLLVEEAGVKLVVSQGQLGELIEGSGAEVVNVEQVLAEDGHDVERSGNAEQKIVRMSSDEQVESEANGKQVESEANIDSSVFAQNIAYIIYTSGSTGSPKGIAISHRNASIMVQWALDLYAPEALKGMLASTSLCFDISIYELFAPLSVGGRVLIADNALELPTLDVKDEVTLINTVPSAMAELVRSHDIPPSVRVVNLAGETLARRLVEQVYEQGEVEAVYNMYGPSEDTTYSTWSLVKRGESSAPTIGRPIANTQAYVVDAQMRVVGIGMPGELYLGGDGLARGYVNRAEATAERFVPDPYSGENGARLYRTGDMVRYREDGELEYIGRIDNQVKVRGYRIELGEIESLLARHPALREAVVVAREDASGDKRLVGYLVPQTEHSISHAELRGFLKTKLPEYMIPTAFVTLSELPLTPNGKVDRRALPAPSDARAELSAATAPRTPVEEMLANIWAEVIGIDRVGIHDNFFELGGHSLLATRIHSRVSQTFKVDVPLRSFFEQPTVAILAALIEQSQPPTEPEQVIQLQPRRKQKRERLLTQLTQLSEAEAKSLLQEKKQPRK